MSDGFNNIIIKQTDKFLRLQLFKSRRACCNCSLYIFASIFFVQSCKIVYEDDDDGDATF